MLCHPVLGVLTVVGSSTHGSKVGAAGTVAAEVMPQQS
jgi:hypothetical protein